MPCKTPFTGDQEADRLLEKDGFALLVAMLLESSIPTCTSAVKFSPPDNVCSGDVGATRSAAVPK